MKINQSNLFLYSIFYIAPFVDALNGFLIFNKILDEGSLLSPGQIFRFYLTALGFLFLKKKQFFVILLSFLAILILEFISFNFHLNFKGFILGFVYSYKILFIVLLYYVFKNILVNTNLINLINMLKNSALLYVGILLVSVFLGIDRSTYESGTFGSKGLFASGNGLSIFLGICSLITFYFYRKAPSKSNLYSFSFILLGTILVGTKASIIFLLISMVLLFIYSKLRVKITLLLTALFLFIYAYDVIIDSFTSVFDVIVYRYNNSDTLIAFLASNRDNYIVEAFKEFNIEGIRFLRFFFGAGVFVSFRDFSDPNLIYDTLENDLFDVFFSFGLIGAIIYLGFIFKGFYMLIKKFNLVLFFCWLSITMYSIIAGHILFNAMSSLVLILVYIIINNIEFIEEK